MPLRRLFAIFALVLVGGILVACGSEDDDATPTATIAPTVAPIETEAVATETETIAPDATPVASPGATPVVDAVSPEATPELGLYTGSEEDLMKTPQVQPPLVATAIEPTAVPMAEVAGRLTLDGRAQQDYTISDEGCVGLGEWRQLKPGAQVIVRDATGTVVDIATLDGDGASDDCVWTFAIDVPGADFFSVSIPMVTEVWFDQNDPAVTSGELELFVP